MNSNFFSSLFYLICVTFFSVEVYALGLPKEGPCTSVGNICSDDCTQILLCTLEGENPIPFETCPANPTGQQQYCGPSAANPDIVDCSHPTPDCGGNVNVLCAEFGEFPHPTKCGSTVRCSEDANGALIPTPTGNKNCAAGEFINALKPNLPCEKGSCPRQAVKCDKPGDHGSTQTGSVYCYTCGSDSTGASSIYVHYCASRVHLRKFSAGKEFKMAVRDILYQSISQPLDIPSRVQRKNDSR